MRGWKRIARALGATTLGLLGACQNPAPQSPYGSEEPQHRDTARAEELTRRAADLIETEPERAESLLREALVADLFHGPAHNNLGVVHLQRDELYAAAQEFEWARKLMPGHPDPRLNLALTLERAGMRADAVESYEAALEVRPGYVPAIQGLARVHLRQAIANEALPTWLQRIALGGETEAWRAWARRHLTLLATGD